MTTSVKSKVESLVERYERRKIKAMIGNLDLFGVIQDYVNTKDEDKEEKKKNLKKLKQICFALDPKDPRLLMAYLKIPRSSPVSEILEKSISRSELTYEEWAWIVYQTFLIFPFKKIRTS